MAGLKDDLSLKTRMFFGALRALGAVGLARPVLAAATGQLHRLSKKWESIFDGFEPSERDVFVAVYPKAGNNWMMQIAVQIAHRGAAEFDHIHGLVVWPHFPMHEVIVPMDSPVHDRSPTGLRVIKTQTPHPSTPYNDKAHYLIVLRDPRDTMVSMYHFVNGIIGGIVDVVRRCAATMGVELTEAETAAVVERSGFAHMKAHESQFTPPIPSPRGQGAKMIRSGKTGEGKRALTAAQRTVLDTHYRKKLAELGSDLPYDAMFNDG
ncbi:MAG: hypothetical protein ACI8S6_000533 [Myxococcota bacterium]|jgi:hypothetical protein